MKKSKADSTLKKQIQKLDNSENMNLSWEIQTRTYLVTYFGENSEQIKVLTGFKWDEIKDKENTKIRVVAFLESCIETINDNGILNQNHNFLERINNQTLITIILFLISGLLYVGYIFGISTTDSKNVELRQENKELRDSLSIKPS